jgi:uncharacterized membrane protein
MTERRSAGADAIDLTVARLLTVGTYLSVALLAGGVLLMAALGRSPLDTPAHDFDPGALLGDLLAGRPDGLLWLGLVILLGTPSARVVASIAGYLRSGERAMAGVGLAILAVVASGVVVGVLLGGTGG